jgi:hypothetical protein
VTIADFREHFMGMSCFYLTLTQEKLDDLKQHPGQVRQFIFAKNGSNDEAELFDLEKPGTAYSICSTARHLAATNLWGGRCLAIRKSAMILVKAPPVA